MGEVEVKWDKVTRHELRHDRHTVSLLTDHLVFSPKYRGKVLEGKVAEASEEIIRETCKELDIEVIDMAVNVDHVHLFIKYPPKYSVSWIGKRIKGRSSKLLEIDFHNLRSGVRDSFMPISRREISFCKAKSASIGRLLVITKLLRKVLSKTLRNQWGMAGTWWRGIYRGRRDTRRLILYL